MRNIIFTVAIPVLMVFAGYNTSAQTKYEWPCFHGPDRTNKSKETGLIEKWPGNGPELLMTIQGLGEGFSSVSIADGLLFTAGIENDQPYVFAFDLNGKLLWKSPSGRKWSTTASWASSYIGPRSTPTYDNGNVYFLGEMGLLTALDARTGKIKWQVDLPQEYEAMPTEYGYSESVMIEGNNLYVRPCGKKGHQVCLDKTTGKLKWANTEIAGVEAYTSPVVADHGGYRHLIGGSSICYYGVDSKSGKLLWKVDVVNQNACNISDAVFYNGYVFISSGYALGSMLYKLNVSGGEIRPEKVWQSALMDNHHGGVIFHDGYVYGSGSKARGWYCLDFMTGAQKWKAGIDEGSITFADGMLYILDQRGTMRLVRATPEKYEVIGEFRVPSGGKGMYWAHPVICDKRLYIRHADKIFVYDVSKKL
jgi:outer membrane protein assembly factor BamB